MKSHVLLLTAIVATTSSFGVSTAQASPPDAQAQAAKLLSGSRSPVQKSVQTSETTLQLGDHPAVIAARTWSTRGLDPNTFVVAHPAPLEFLAASPSEKERTEVQAAATTQVLGATATGR